MKTNGNPFLKDSASWLAVSTLLVLALGAWSSVQAAQNVLLIIADDYGADSSSLYNSTTNGASLPPTPNIEALARSGIVFSRAYANPVCSATRACLMTGRHAFRHGIGYVIRAEPAGTTDPRLRAAEFTLPEAFRANAALGYQLAQFGKWHLGGWGFDQTSQANDDAPNVIGGWPHFAGCLGGALGSMTDPTRYTNWTKTVNGTQTSGYTNYATTDIVDDATAWIRARGSQPWFAWIAFNASHWPLHKPPNHLHSYDSLPGTAAHISANPRPYFEAMVEAMDTEIGRLLSAVDRTNTHIIFIGDNGTEPNVIQPPYPSSHAKYTLYEGGIKVPLIIAGPAVVNPGRTSDTLTHTVDLFATILELASISVAATVPASTTVDSHSLLPVLQGATDSSRCVYADLFLASSPTPSDGRTLRNSQFKLIRFHSGREEFYDLGADPFERTNLLSSSLSEIQRANYYALTMKLGNYQNELAPPLINGFTRGASRFSVTVPLATNLAHHLWKAATPADLAWAPLTNALVVTNGMTTVTLTDTNAGDPAQFYRVEANRR
jgi:arylsulfatase A-like enzyme